jgi:hypothetical protein
MADVESSGGKNIDHPRNPDNQLPAGALGVKPNMLYDLYSKDPEFRQYVQNNSPLGTTDTIKQYPQLTSKDPISNLIKAHRPC